MDASLCLRARGERVGDRWAGVLEVPTLHGPLVLTASVTDADVAALVRALRRLHAALHAMDDGTRVALLEELAGHEAVGWCGWDDDAPEVGIWPIVAAIAVPLITAGIQAGISSTTPGHGGGLPSGAQVTTFRDNPLNDVPRASGPSVEEVRAYWRGRGGDDPDIITPREVSPDGFTFGGLRIPNTARLQRDGDLAWLAAYSSGYFGGQYERAADVPANVRAAWDQSRANAVPLWRTMGLQAAPTSPVLVGTQLTYAPGQGFALAPESWSHPSNTAGQMAASALAAIAQGLGSAAGGGLNAQQTVTGLLSAFGPALQQAAASDPQNAAVLNAALQLAGQGAGLLGGQGGQGAGNPLAGLLGGQGGQGAGNPLAGLLGGQGGQGGVLQSLAGLFQGGHGGQGGQGGQGLQGLAQSLSGLLAGGQGGQGLTQMLQGLASGTQTPNGQTAPLLGISQLLGAAGQAVPGSTGSAPGLLDQLLTRAGSSPSSSGSGLLSSILGGAR